MPSRKAARNVNILPWMSARADCKEGRFLQVGNSLLCGQNSAFKDLTTGAQMLYICMAMESGGKNTVAFSRSTAKNYGIDKNSLQRRIKDLIEHGFIEIDVEGSYSQFKPTVYRFVCGWKEQNPAPKTGSSKAQY